MRRFLFAVFLVMACATSVAAGPREDAISAYDRGDYTLAARLIRSLAEQGDALAQGTLGVMYQEGQGVQQNSREAEKWFRKASEQGEVHSQYVLGKLYDEGKGVPQDYQEAVKWYRKAAEQGLAAAQGDLGVMYEKGQGVPQDAQEAAKWFHKAAEQGVAQAKTTRVTNPYRSVDGVLVIAGEGLNSTYDDISLSAMVFIFSVKVSESLCDEIVRTGTSAECYVNRDKVAEPISYIGPLILKNKRDGLAQIFVQHIKNEQENAVYLTVTYTPLILQKDGSSVVGEAYSERYRLNEAPSASDLARDFAQKLVSRGYIGNE